MNDEATRSERVVHVHWARSRAREHHELTLPGIDVYAAIVPSPLLTSRGRGEDAIGVWTSSEGHLVLAVADGMGGARGGGAASALAIRSLDDALSQPMPTRHAILDAFETADQAARARRAVGKTTLVVAQQSADQLRLYNAGDSEALVVSRRGTIKLRTVVHSPVGYQVAAGVLEHDEALQHAERHYISNVVGAPELKIEVGPRVTLARHDTVALGSDGLFDNVRPEELAHFLSLPDMAGGGEALVNLALSRMHTPTEDGVGKPDDLSLLMTRRHTG